MKKIRFILAFLLIGTFTIAATSAGVSSSTESTKAKTAKTVNAKKAPTPPPFAPYTLQLHENLGKIVADFITIPKGEVMHVLNDNSDPSNIRTFLLVNQTAPTYTVPNYPPGWSYQKLYKAVHEKYQIDHGDNLRVILDENLCSYYEIH